jgi:hypothetical protein
MNSDLHTCREALAKKRKELQDWRATLTKDEDQYVEMLISVKGEGYVLETLDFLKDQLEIARTL